MPSTPAFLSRALSLCALTLVPAAAVRAQTAADLEIVLSCPAGANSPENPQNPQATTAQCFGNLYDMGCICRVYWANRVDGDLTNVDFTISAGGLPEFAISTPAETPDGNANLDLQNWLGGSMWATPASIANWFGDTRDGVTAKTPTVAGIMQAQVTAPVTATSFQPLPGDPYGPAGVVVRYPAILEGESGAFDIRVRGSIYPSQTPIVANLVARASSTTTPFVSIPQVVPMQADTAPALSVTAFSARVLANAPSVGAAGQAYNPKYPSFISRVTMDVYLPYWDSATGTIKADRFYDPIDGDELIHDPATLGVNARTSCNPGAGGWCSGNYANLRTTVLDPGETDAPATGANAGQLLERIPGTNHLRLRAGFTTYTWLYSLSYTGSLTPEYAAMLLNPGSTFPGGQFCATADVLGATEICDSKSITVVPVPGTSPHNQLIEYSYPKSTAGQAYSETWAITQDRYHQRHIYLMLESFVELAPLSQLTLDMQLGGRTSKRERFHLISAGASSGYMLPSSVPVIQVTTTPGAYGFETQLGQRVVPPAGAVWVDCLDAAGHTQPTCSRADLVRLGVDPDAVDTVRIYWPSVPQSLSVENARAGIGLYTYLDPDVPSSVDDPFALTPSGAGSRDDMTHAALGTKSIARFTIEGQAVSVYSSGAQEFDPNLRSAPRMLFGGGWFEVDHSDPWGPVQAFQRTPVLCYFGNLGESNVYYPLTFDMVMPEGFVTDPSQNADFVFSGYGRPAHPSTSASRTWNPSTRTLSVTVTGPTPLYGQDSPYDPTDVYPYGFTIGAYGVFGESAPFDAPASCRVRTTYDHRDGSTRTFDVTGLTSFQVVGRHPALAVSAQSQSTLVEAHGDFDVELAVRNVAYRDDGSLAPNGATGPAGHTTLYLRVPRDGDFDESLENGVARAVFGGASSPDALSIWLHSGETPAQGESAITPANGWVHCSDAPDPCDAAALAAAGINDPGDVRWVVFLLGEVRVTDADGRGTTPRVGVPRVDNPYRATVTLVDDGSSDLATLRSFVELLSPDSASPASFDGSGVTVDGGCDASIPSVGFDEPEICDGIDNDCDELVDEDDVCLGRLAVDVFFDVAADGTENGSDARLSGWTVTVTGPGATLLGSGPTNGSGHYELPLEAGPVTVTLTDPGGFAPSLSWSSTTGGRVTTASIAATSTTTIAFGEVCGCDDDDPCTVDSCAAPGVCGTSAVPDLPATSCDDGAWCNGADACQGGQCRPIAGTEPCVATQQCVASTCDEELDRCVASDARDSVCLEGGWAFYVAVRSDGGASGVVKCTVQAGATTASCDSSTILDSACE